MTRPAPRRPVTERRLTQMGSFASCTCQASQPNMDHGRELLRDAMLALKREKEDSLHWLGLVSKIATAEKNAGLYEDVGHTIKAKQQEIEAIDEGLESGRQR